MMRRKKKIFDGEYIKLTIDRLCHEVIENHNDLDNTAILGLQNRGVFFAQRLKKRLDDFTGKKIDLGYLDVTFFRDDFRRRKTPLSPSKTTFNFEIENRRIILVDDVLFTGRTIRAALSSLNSYGRAKDIELLVMIDRNDSRELPIQPNYVGRDVSTFIDQKVLVELKEEGFKDDNIYLVHNDE